jgi:hypothetical protein
MRPPLAQTHPTAVRQTRQTYETAEKSQSMLAVAPLIPSVRHSYTLKTALTLDQVMTTRDTAMRPFHRSYIDSQESRARSVNHTAGP